MAELHLGDMVKVKKTEEIGAVVQIQPARKESHKLYILDLDPFHPYAREELEPTLLKMEDWRDFYARGEED